MGRKVGELECVRVCACVGVWDGRKLHGRAWMQLDVFAGGGEAGKEPAVEYDRNHHPRTG